MQKAALIRPGAWLCLLGSALALAGFFLPYDSPSAVSLWHIFVFWVFQRPNTPFEVAAGIIGVLLLGTLSIAILAVLALSPRPPGWNILGLFLSVISITLFCYFIAFLIYLYADWIGAEIANTSPQEITFLDILSQLSIGAWLIPLGLVLALIGGILLKREEARAGG